MKASCAPQIAILTGRTAIRRRKIAFLPTAEEVLEAVEAEDDEED